MNLRETKRPVEWPKAGWYWFLHHDTMVEWTDDIDERWDYVCREKPYEELETRQKWMRPVKGEMPVEFIAAWVEYAAARAKYETAWVKYDKTWTKYETAQAKYKPQIEALMREELPGVPWDGKTLLMQAEGEGEKDGD